MSQLENSSQGTSASGVPHLQKVAIAMAALGEAVAGEAMKFLSDHQIEVIAAALVDLADLSADTMDRVLAGFAPDVVVADRDTGWPRGVDFARDALPRAIGPRMTQEIMARVLPVDRAIYDDESVAPDEIWKAVQKCRPFICRIATQEHETPIAGHFREQEVPVGSHPPTRGGVAGVTLEQRAGPPYEAYQRPQCPHFDDGPLREARRGLCDNLVPEDPQSVLYCDYSSHWRSDDD